MSYILNVKEMLKTKSRVFIFLKQDQKGTTTKLSEAGIWEEHETNNILKNKDFANCKESSLIYLEKKDDSIKFNALSKKYFQVGK